MEILFKTGQEFERMALGELNKEKQKEAKEPYVRALAIDRVFHTLKMRKLEEPLLTKN